MKIYLDTNVFVSLVREEIGFGFRSLFAEANDFFEKLRTKNDFLVISNLFIEEVSKTTGLKEPDIMNILENISENILVVKDYTLNIKYLHSRGIHYPDSVHLRTALKNKCEFLITFNKRDFANSQEPITIIEPSEY